MIASIFFMLIFLSLTGRSICSANLVRISERNSRFHNGATRSNQLMTTPGDDVLYIAASPFSPVRMRSISSMSDTNIFPSPISPVRADLMI